MNVLPVEIWSDVACPWCWIGKRHLEAAAEGVEIVLDVTWRSFELDPNAPPSPEEPVDYAARISAKYGVPQEQAQEMIDRITRAGENAGVSLRFDRIRPGNTFDAHRLLHLAREHGVQTALKERLFKRYLEEGDAISHRGVLAQAASDVALPTGEVDEVLSSDRYGQEVREDEARAHQLGVSGVPFFVVGGRYALGGAQPPEVLRQAIERSIGEAGATTVGGAAPE